MTILTVVSLVEECAIQESQTQKRPRNAQLGMKREFRQEQLMPEDLKSHLLFQNLVLAMDQKTAQER
jgi:hypothetical protein